MATLAADDVGILELRINDSLWRTKRWLDSRCLKMAPATHTPSNSELATWLDRKHGQVGFYLAQALSGHGCFNAYLKRFKKRDDESCRYCGYSLLTRWCQQWGPLEIASGPASAVLRLGRAWLSASIGGGIFLFLPWLARLVGLPNGRVCADRSPGRTDDGRVVRDFKLEPTAREV